MNHLLKMIHDAWCGLTGTCSVTPEPAELLEEDPYIDWLKKEKRESEHRVQEQASNRLEVAYLYGQLNNRKADDHG